MRACVHVRWFVVAVWAWCVLNIVLEEKKTPSLINNSWPHDQDGINSLFSSSWRQHAAVCLTCSSVGQNKATAWLLLVLISVGTNGDNHEEFVFCVISCTHSSQANEATFKSSMKRKGAGRGQAYLTWQALETRLNQRSLPAGALDAAHPWRVTGNVTSCFKILTS